MESKQYTSKEPRSHWINQRGSQKMFRDKWKQKHNDPKAMFAMVQKHFYQGNLYQ